MRRWSRTWRRPSAASTRRPTATAPAPRSRSSWSSIQVVGQRPARGRGVPERVAPSRAEPAPRPPRRAYFGAQHGWLETPVLRRSDLATARPGPLIVEEYDATCVVPPGARAELDAGGNIVIELSRRLVTGIHRHHAARGVLYRPPSKRFRAQAARHPR